MRSVLLAALLLTGWMAVGCGGDNGLATSGDAEEQYVYTVQEGDTAIAISAKVYDDPNHWPAIAEANPGVDPHQLKAGQKLVIPMLEMDDGTMKIPKFCERCSIY